MNDKALRCVLLADGLIAFVVAAAMLVATALYAEHTGLPESLLRWAAVILLGYGIAFTLAALLRLLRRGLVVALIVANFAWAVASFVVLALVTTLPFGAFYVIAQALIAASFGVAELVTLRRVRD